MIKWGSMVLRSIAELYRKGFALFVLAPLAVALVMLPEFAQHVVEIDLGMFDSREAARLASGDTLRWTFGYVKIAGLVLAYFAAARVWWCRAHGGRWYDLRELAWGRFLGGLLAFVLIGMLAEPFAGRIVEPVLTILQISLMMASLPFLFLALSGFFGDRSLSLAVIARRCWPYVALLLILLPVAFAPAMFLHHMNHKWAIGAPGALVWALMVFDSLVVGLLAGLTGTALYLGYERFAERLAKQA